MLFERCQELGMGRRGTRPLTALAHTVPWLGWHVSLLV